MTSTNSRHSSTITDHANSIFLRLWKLVREAWYYSQLNEFRETLIVPLLIFLKIKAYHLYQDTFLSFFSVYKLWKEEFATW